MSSDDVAGRGPDVLGDLSNLGNAARLLALHEKLVGHVRPQAARECADLLVSIKSQIPDVSLGASFINTEIEGNQLSIDEAVNKISATSESHCFRLQGQKHEHYSIEKWRARLPKFNDRSLYMLMAWRRKNQREVPLADVKFPKAVCDQLPDGKFNIVEIIDAKS